VVTSNRQPLLILGTHALAEEVWDLISDMPGFEVTGFVENMNRDRCGQTLEGLPILWIDDIAPYAETHKAICALGTTHRSRFIEQAAAFGFQFATVVHPTARVSTHSSVGDGTIISAGVIVATRTEIGRHVFINRGALIGHHTQIGDYVSIMPGANVAGKCRIGDATYIGIGAIVIDGITVGEHSVVGAGSVVTRDVESNVQVVGIPAVVARENISGK
jgi:sugar O-acyltransferase (sialic acid O-acetyltransferase NeuD family)